MNARNVLYFIDPTWHSAHLFYCEWCKILLFLLCLWEDSVEIILLRESLWWHQTEPTDERFHSPSCIMWVNGNIGMFKHHTHTSTVINLFCRWRTRKKHEWISNDFHHYSQRHSSSSAVHSRFITDLKNIWMSSEFSIPTQNKWTHEYHTHLKFDLCDTRMNIWVKSTSV